MPDTSPQAGFSTCYSLAHLSILGCSVPEMIYIAARAGYDAVSPRLLRMGIDGECPHPPLDKEAVRAARLALLVTGLKVHDIELCRLQAGFDLKTVEPMIAVGAEWGAKAMIASAWGELDESYLVDCYAQVCELAARYHLSVALEFLPFSRLTTLAAAVAVVDQAKQANGGLLLDTLYLHFTQTRADELARLPSKWLSFIHIADALATLPSSPTEMMRVARGARLYPGEGVIDFLSIMEKLPPMHYSIELPNLSRVEVLGYEEHARRCLLAAKQVLGKLKSRPVVDKIHS